MQQWNKRTTIFKKFQVEMAHKLVTDYPTPCNRLHGHSYTIELGIIGDGLDNNGMICDFTKLKLFVNQIKDIFDHKTLIYDPDILKSDTHDAAITKVNYNPTAENMAEDIARRLLKYIDSDLEISIRGVIVSVNETQNNKAVVQIDVE